MVNALHTNDFVKVAPLEQLVVCKNATNAQLLLKYSFFQEPLVSFVLI